jgi:hypothetical protein
VSRYPPWLLDGASPERTVLVLARMPEQLVAACRDQWRPAYAGLDLRRTTSEATAS